MNIENMAAMLSVLLLFLAVLRYSDVVMHDTWIDCYSSKEQCIKPSHR